MRLARSQVVRLWSKAPRNGREADGAEERERAWRARRRYGGQGEVRTLEQSWARGPWRSGRPRRGCAWRARRRYGGQGEARTPEQSSSKRARVRGERRGQQGATRESRALAGGTETTEACREDEAGGDDGDLDGPKARNGCGPRRGCAWRARRRYGGQGEARTLEQSSSKRARGPWGGESALGALAARRRQETGARPAGRMRASRAREREGREERARLARSQAVRRPGGGEGSGAEPSKRARGP